MTALEEALSRALADRAGVPVPQMGDLAGRAIAAGRAHRRRQFAGAAAAAVVCAALAISLVATIGSVGTVDEGPTDHAAEVPGEYVAVSTPMPAPVPDLPVDYVHNNLLHLRGGRSIPLPVAEWSGVFRAPDGFIAVANGPSDDQRAWYVPERTGSPAMMLDGARSIAVADDGTGRIAWVSDSAMYYRESVFTAEEKPYTVLTFQTQRPAAGRPVGFVGEAVLLADARPGGASRHDLWFPDRGDYVPTWASLAAVFGMRARTDLVVGRSLKGRYCLSTVPVETLKVDDADCYRLNREPTAGWVSPSRRWLVVADREQAQMIDLSAGWKHCVTVALNVEKAITDAAWLDQDTVALHTSAGVVVLSPFASDPAVGYKIPTRSVIVT